MYVFASDFWVNADSLRSAEMIPERIFSPPGSADCEFHRGDENFLPSQIPSKSRMVPADSCQLFTLAPVTKTAIVVILS